MDEKQIRDHINSRREELRELTVFWQGFKEWAKELGIGDQTVAEVSVRVSSRMAYLERSIRDHKALLPDGA